MMDVLFYLGCLASIVCLVTIVVKAALNSKLLTNRYEQFKVNFCLSNCGDVVKNDDFFKMHNDGEDICESLEDIAYVDYIGNSEIFVKKVLK